MKFFGCLSSTLLFYYYFFWGQSVLLKVIESDLDAAWQTNVYGAVARANLLCEGNCTYISKYRRWCLCSLTCTSCPSRYIYIISNILSMMYVSYFQFIDVRSKKSNTHPNIGSRFAFLMCAKENKNFFRMSRKILTQRSYSVNFNIAAGGCPWLQGGELPKNWGNLQMHENPLFFKPQFRSSELFFWWNFGDDNYNYWMVFTFISCRMDVFAFFFNNLYSYITWIQFNYNMLGRGFKYSLFSPLPGEDSHFV